MASHNPIGTRKILRRWVEVSGKQILLGWGAGPEIVCESAEILRFDGFQLRHRPGRRGPHGHCPPVFSVEPREHRARTDSVWGHGLVGRCRWDRASPDVCSAGPPGGLCSIQFLNRDHQPAVHPQYSPFNLNGTLRLGGALPLGLLLVPLLLLPLAPVFQTPQQNRHGQGAVAGRLQYKNLHRFQIPGPGPCREFQIVVQSCQLSNRQSQRRKEQPR